MSEQPQPHSAGRAAHRSRVDAHLVPTSEQRSAADAFLRGEPLASGMQPLLDQAIAEFGWPERQYIEEARAQGDRSRVWDTTCWILANAIAQQAVAQADQ